MVSADRLGREGYLGPGGGKLRVQGATQGGFRRSRPTGGAPFRRRSSLGANGLGSLNGRARRRARGAWASRASGELAQAPGPGARGDRSEERRVGKECRSRWSPY